MGTNLHHGTTLDERGNLLPSLAVLFEALEEETVFLGGPSAGILGCRRRSGSRGRGGCSTTSSSSGGSRSSRVGQVVMHVVVVVVDVVMMMLVVEMVVVLNNGRSG